MQHFRQLIRRGLPKVGSGWPAFLKAGGVLSMVLLGVSPALAAQTPRHAAKRAMTHSAARAHVAVCDPHAPEPRSIQQIVNQTKAVGGPVSKRLRRTRFEFHRTMTLSRPVRAAHDDDAIQNDAPAAHAAVDPFFTLRPLGLFVDVLVQQPFTVAYSPLSPRGPPYDI